MIDSSVTAISYGDPKVGALNGAAKGIQVSMLKIEAAQKSLASGFTDTAFLINSIGNRLKITGVVVGEVGSGVLYPVGYGVYVEFGTYKMVAQPHIRPGAESVVNSGQSKAIMIKYGNEQMEKELATRKRERKLNG